MLYIILLNLVFSLVSCQEDPITINGTEFRGMANNTLWEREDYWYVNMTNEMVEPRMIESENDTQNSWLTTNNKTIDDLEANKTNFNSYVDTVKGGYGSRVVTWKSGFE